MRRKRIVVFLAAGIVAAQQAPPVATFRAGTQLVTVSVVAQDKKGQPIADLRREDFQIFDNGWPRELRLFVAETDKSNFVPEISAPTPPNTFTNQITSAAGSHSGYSVILIDSLSTNFGDPLKGSGEEGIGSAKERTLRMLRSIPAGERIAIYALGRKKLQVICEFTSDWDSLERQLRTWKPLIDIPATSLDILEPNEANAPESVRIEAARVDALQRASGSNDEMEQVADHLAGIPGRKNLIWISDNRFVMDPRALRKFTDAGIAIYPVDAQGVCRVCPPRPKDAMNAIAAFTGGIAYFERNDLDIAIREAMDDGRVSYTLGFYASSNDRTPLVHQLTVSTTRPGVTLRYRASYQTEPPKPASTSPVADLVKAMNRPVDATSVPITATATRTQDRLNLVLSFDVSSLGLELNQGLWKGKTELVARFMTADGVQAGDVVSQTVTFNLRPAT